MNFENGLFNKFKISPSSCCADKVIRSLSVCFGTVGGLIAVTMIPLSKSILLTRMASSLSPINRGCIAVSEGSKLKPFLFSISTFALGDINADGYGSIQNVIYSQFEKSSKWLAPLLSIIITISITTAVSGTIIGTSKLMTDLSASNSIKDTNGRFLKRNNYSATPNSTLAIMILSLFWFMTLNLLNTIFLVTMDASELKATSNVIPISDFASDLLTVGAFGSYSIVIFGGILNRFTNKVEVKKQKGFLFFAIVTVTTMMIVTIYFAYSIFIPTQGINTTYILKIVFTFIFIISFVISVMLNIKRSETLTEDELEEKEKIKEEYFYINQQPK